MTKLDFFFDPRCPWAWLTSLWVREVQKQRPLDVEWKFFSLAEINELDAARNGPLRIAAQARREGGNSAVDLAYLGLGRMFHERRERPETLEDLESIVHDSLQEVGLDPELARRALADDSTLDDVLSDHREAVEKLGAFGVPWLLLDDGTNGFFGPVIGERLRGKQALELWDHFLWTSAQPYLFELKRGRSSLPKLQGLSEEFMGAVPAGSTKR
jgi:2-hydroxychromene-2-carboxylate isomerase